MQSDKKGKKGLDSGYVRGYHDYMMTGIKEAKSNLSKLVDAALAGEEVFLSNRGDAVIRLVPVPKAASPERGRGFLKAKLNLYPGWDSEAEDLKIQEAFESSLNA